MDLNLTQLETWTDLSSVFTVVRDVLLRRVHGVLKASFSSTSILYQLGCIRLGVLQVDDETPQHCKLSLASCTEIN